MSCTTKRRALASEVENLVLMEGVQTGLGNALNNTITGNSADNTLDGGVGADTLVGGAGDDTYYVDQASDMVIEAANEGLDTVIANSDYVLPDHVEQLIMEGNSYYHGVGNADNNAMYSSEAGSWLEGGAGSDTLYGDSGNDVLDGGMGADVMAGGEGDDSYFVDSVNDAVVELVNEGTDTVHANMDYMLGDHLENLTLLGSANLSGTGNALNNVIEGNTGNNVLDGGAGSNALYGGAGDDYYITRSAQDQVTEWAGEGSDTIERHFNTTLVLENNVENLLLGSGVVYGNGNNLSNRIDGNSQNNNMSGLAGDDALYGYDGDDALFGGAGEDVLYGGKGDDYLDGGADSDT